MVKKNACVFISGTGTNLKSLIKSSRVYNFPIKISCVVSSTKKANGLNFAKKNKIPFYILNLNNRLNLEIILQKLKEKNISLICLAGYMKILKKKFINNFGGQIINIHPSLLPKYKGLNTHNRAIQNRDKFSGCTVHYVTEKLDSGKIIMQRKVKITKKDTPTTLAKKVLKQEHRLYPEAILKIFN
jgi:phosphoribosylglycinamide formyltransferase-1